MRFSNLINKLLLVNNEKGVLEVFVVIAHGQSHNRKVKELDLSVVHVLNKWLLVIVQYMHRCGQSLFHQNKLPTDCNLNQTIDFSACNGINDDIGKWTSQQFS